MLNEATQHEPYTKAEVLAALGRIHKSAWCVYCGGGPATDADNMLIEQYVAQVNGELETLRAYRAKVEAAVKQEGAYKS